MEQIVFTETVFSKLKSVSKGYKNESCEEAYIWLGCTFRPIFHTKHVCDSVVWAL